ncbi:GNAT family N-acetyltransferase [Candidatus Albibeggiatoa sp. nov. NOAA]|uniref:GNAT family N-acetyltransferase n=1 Tax=Candidatus Albibeggiatoa sp. nov. NOAA TaxID=3162724 RepID=UPI0032F49F10|nr:GNAT family N-acetyltransferase [Thiotrichaceae bacterium]
MQVSFKQPISGFTFHLGLMSDEHHKHLIKLAQNPQLSDSMGWDTFFKDDDIKGFLSAISEHALPYSQVSQAVIFGIYPSSEALPVGYVVLKGFNPDLQTAEIGIAILDQKFKGLGRLAAGLMIEYGFAKLQLNTIAATILCSNQNSINTSKKLGFETKSILYQSWTLPSGELTDMVWQELNSTTWNKQIVSKQFQINIII